MNITKRRSVRKYKNIDIEDNILKSIIASSLQAPSARNQQPWSFMIIKNKDILNQLANSSRYAAFLSNTPCVIAVIMKDLTLMPTPDMVPIDLSMVSTYIMLEALNYNLGTCYMGIWPREDRTKNCDTILNLNQTEHTFALISIGYPLSNDVFTEANDRFNEDLISWVK